MEYIDGQTPLDEDEKEGLLIDSITTRGELDEFEQLNIQKAVKWSMSQSLKMEEILTEEFVRRLHKRMFDETWAWAGFFRKSNKNIGVDWHTIGTALNHLLGDCRYWIEHGTYRDQDELVIRFKHRLVNIHCFPNGNGRHSRLMADILIKYVFDRSEFTWGSGNDLVAKGNARAEYISAIRTADKGDIFPLVKFARS